MTKANKHIRINGKYLQDAKELLKKQDYLQASEKLWGAAAQIVKAVALRDGKILRSHEALNRYIVILSRELHDKSILGHFHVAGNLHQNFYEDCLPPEMVIEGAKTIEKLIKKLKPLAE